MWYASFLTLRLHTQQHSSAGAGESVLCALAGDEEARAHPDDTDVHESPQCVRRGPARAGGARATGAPISTCIVWWVMLNCSCMSACARWTSRCRRLCSTPISRSLRAHPSPRLPLMCLTSTATTMLLFRSVCALIGTSHITPSSPTSRRSQYSCKHALAVYPSLKRHTTWCWYVRACTASLRLTYRWQRSSIRVDVSYVEEAIGCLGHLVYRDPRLRARLQPVGQSLVALALADGSFGVKTAYLVVCAVGVRASLVSRMAGVIPHRHRMQHRTAAASS